MIHQRQHRREQLNNHRIRICLRKALICFAFGLAFVLLVAPAQAVEPGKTSYTAEAVCAFRAIGAQDPDPKTRNPDHLAKRFMNPLWNQRFPGLGLVYQDAKLVMDRMNTGVYYYVNARTLHMDAMLTTTLKAGARQLVIMGAGFDSRAYRFHDSYPQVRFFEIDLPATSANKQQRVQKVLGRKPAWVTFVPIDFNTQTLGEVLGEEVCTYFRSSLADFFSIPAHHLMIYAVSFILFGVGVFAALAIYDYSDLLINIELKFMGMNAWHTAANLTVCTILADMLFAYVVRPWGAYERRTVGKTWIIFFAGFLLGFLSERTVAYKLIGFL